MYFALNIDASFWTAAVLRRSSQTKTQPQPRSSTNSTPTNRHHILA